MSSNSSRICVAVRKRPIPDPDKDIVETHSPHLIVNEPKIKYDLTPYTDRHQFTYDQVISDTMNNNDVYEHCCVPLINTVFNHGNATCFAYGQTGSGKTHTMLGTRNEPGLYAIAAKDIFSRAKQIHAEVYVSFYEIYGRKIFDLLNNREKLVAREDAEKVINICGLSEHKVNDIQAIFDVITAGSAYRAAGQTSANNESSRSHAVLQMEIRETLNANNRRSGPRAIGRISFIDLAGNERGADTFDCDRKTRMEGAEINKSLLALKECIRSLGMGKSHVPFRGSILTEVLRDSFVGNSRTTMIATISPSSSHCVNTLNTLRYTQRVKDLGGEESRPSPENPQVKRPIAQIKKRAFETPPPIRPRPEWVTDFAEQNEDGGGEPPTSDQQKQSNRSRASAANANVNANANAGGRLKRNGSLSALPPGSPINNNQRRAAEIKVKDPKIATIVQHHMDALAVISDSDEEDDESEAPVDDNHTKGNNALRERILARAEARQVRKVHAVVVEKIAKAEDKLVALHRRHIDARMTGIKEEIRAIQAFEDSDSVDEYVVKIRTLLQKQKNDMNQILGLLDSISSMLKDEEELSCTLTSSMFKAK